MDSKGLLEAINQVVSYGKYKGRQLLDLAEHYLSVAFAPIGPPILSRSASLVVSTLYRLTWSSISLQPS
jgi:hypothetical protein